MKPFLRWAGGKQFLLKYLLKSVKRTAKDATYFEPFLGAGSLFLCLQPEKAILSDLNEHLINFYDTVKNNPIQLHRYLQKYQKNSSRDHYYQVRDQFNKNLDSKTASQAARFIYLNRLCFNGIFRVNSQGQYNVPFDASKKLIFPTLKDLIELSDMLGRAELLNCSYEKILPKVRPDDFVYLDPPYPPLNGTAYFTHYTKDRFSIEDQVRVADFARKLSQEGCKVLVSNADLKEIRLMYSDWHVFATRVPRYISCKKQKQRVSELIITNYVPDEQGGTS